MFQINFTVHVAGLHVHYVFNATLYTLML